MRQVCRRLDGAFTLVVAHRDHPGRLVAARRNSPLVLGVGEGETFLASDVAAFVEHTRDAVELGQDQVVEITAGRLRGDRLRRQPGRGLAVPGRLGPRRRREGRLRLLHAQGDPGAAGGGRGHAARPVRGRQGRAGRAADGRAGAPRRGQGVRRRLRHRVPLGADREVRDRALDPDPGRGRDGLGVPLPGPGAGPGHAGRRDLAERGDRGHAGGGPARAGTEGARARDLQRQRRADPAGVRRGALHQGRAGDRGGRDQDVPGPARGDAAGRAGAGRREGHEVSATRSPASSTRWSRCRR